MSKDRILKFLGGCIFETRCSGCGQLPLVGQTHDNSSCKYNGRMLLNKYEDNWLKTVIINVKPSV